MLSHWKLWDDSIFSLFVIICIFVISWHQVDSVTFLNVFKIIPHLCYVMNLRKVTPGWCQGASTLGHPHVLKLCQYDNWFTGENRRKHLHTLYFFTLLLYNVLRNTFIGKHPHVGILPDPVRCKCGINVIFEVGVVLVCDSSEPVNPSSVYLVLPHGKFITSSIFFVKKIFSSFGRKHVRINIRHQSVQIAGDKCSMMLKRNYSLSCKTDRWVYML